MFEELMKMVAINFANWIANEFYIVSTNNLWYKNSDGNPHEGLNIEELYDLFLESERSRLSFNK